MIELNKNKLIPANTTAWGDITGKIEDQQDLVSMLSSYATESWVSDQGYLKSVPSTYATKSWVSDQGYLKSVPSTYATKSWVSDQGYLKSVPSSYATKSWVSDQGYLTEHQPLKTINSQSLVGTGNIVIETSVPEYYATKSWVSEQGYLTSETLPSDLATESWVSSQGFATESWVSSQGYLTSVPEGYATESWVQSQGYLTSETLPSDLATESWVSSQGFATETWVSGQGYLTSVPEGYATESWISAQGYITSNNSAVIPLFSKSLGLLRYNVLSVSNVIVKNSNGTQFFDAYGCHYVWKVAGDVYGINFLTPEYDDQNIPHTYIYKYNKTTDAFEHVLNNGNWVEVWGSAVTIPLISNQNNPHFLWEDNSGRVYFANKYQVNLQTGEFTEVVPGGDMGGQLTTYYGSKHNIIKRPNDGIYMFYASSASNGTAYKFNEETQLFENFGYFKQAGSKQYYRYSFYHDGELFILAQAGNLKQINLTSANTFTCQTVNPYWWNNNAVVDDQGNVRTVEGDRILTVDMEIGGVTQPVHLFYFSLNIWALLYDENYMSYQWVKQDVYIGDTITYNTDGAECGNYLVGYGRYDESGVIPVWKFGISETVEKYGWDETPLVETDTLKSEVLVLQGNYNSLDYRVSALETNYGDALLQTQNILS